MAAGDLTTLDAVKAYLGLSSQGDDAELETLITAYSDGVSQYCSRTFPVTTHDIWRSGNGGCAMQLPDWPIVSVSTVEVDGQAIAAAPSFTATGYRFDDRSIILNGYRFCRGVSNVHLVFSAGYSSIPVSLAQAVNELVALRYKERERIGHASKSLAGETVAFITKAMPDSVKQILQSFTKIAPL